MSRLSLRHLRGLSEQVRIDLFELLCLNLQPLTTSTIANVLDMKSATVSHHLVILEQQGLVISMKSGRNVLYAPNRGAVLVLAETFTVLTKGDQNVTQ